MCVQALECSAQPIRLSPDHSTNCRSKATHFSSNSLRLPSASAAGITLGNPCALSSSKCSTNSTPCPGAKARACGSRSKGRGRRLLTYMEQRGFITSRSGLGNTRAITLPALGWETALGDPNADDVADAPDEGGLFAAG